MKKKILLLFIVITVGSIFVHFWNYSNLVNFTIDPPVHITAAREMVESGKISLVGPNITSKEVMGRELFLGPFYYYVLAILGILTHWNILIISAFFTCIWLATFAIIFFWLNKKFNWQIAIPIYTILSFYPFFIQVSRQIWNLQFIPLFGILFLLCLVERKKIIHYLLTGIFWGLGLNVHYSTIFWIFIAIYFVIYEIHKKQFHLTDWLVVILGVVLAELPLIFFEFRHNFYNINTLIFQIRYGKLSQGYTFTAWYYYVLPLLPLAVYLAGKILFNVRKTRIYTPILVILSVLSIYLIILSIGPDGQKTFFFPGWNIPKQESVANMIVNDDEKQFEVSETINSDTRATDLRWWINNSRVKIMDVTQYDKAPILYLVTPESRPPEKESVWEVSSLRPFKTVYKTDIGGGLYLYKLKRL